MVVLLLRWLYEIVVTAICFCEGSIVAATLLFAVLTDLEISH